MVPEYKEEGVCRATNIRKGKRSFFISGGVAPLSGVWPSLGPSSVHFNLYYPWSQPASGLRHPSILFVRKSGPSSGHTARG